VERINTTRRRWKKRAEYAATDMRRERERADRIETMWAQRARELSNEQVPLLAELEQARRTARLAEQRTADYDKVVAERDAATRYAQDLAASFTSDKNNVRQIVRDWDWLVAAYFRSRSAASLSERERAIRTRWSQFRRSGAQSTTHTPARALQCVIMDPTRELLHGVTGSNTIQRDVNVIRGPQCASAECR